MFNGNINCEVFCVGKGVFFRYISLLPWLQVALEVDLVMQEEVEFIAPGQKCWGVLCRLVGQEYS